MKKAKQRFYEQLNEKLQQVNNRLLELTLDGIDYPDFNPARAEQLTQELLSQGRLAVVTEGMKGLCV